CLLSIGIVANGKDLKEHVTFTQKIWVNDTLVEPGRYLIRYDAAMGVMKIMEGDEVVAQAQATVTVNDEKFDQDAVLLNTTSKGEVLTGIRLGGQREELHLSEIIASVETVEFDLDKYSDFDLCLNE
ncbi:MAG TPA: hypothetical protein VGB07_02160, partial [Blastocatellia bacterium]